MRITIMTAPRIWAGMEFVPIAKGSFVMGSMEGDELAYADENPQHTLDIPYDYWLGRYPLSNAQFIEFVQATSYVTRAEREGWAWVWDRRDGQWGKKYGADWGHPLGAESSLNGLERHPVVNVCWYDALAYCAWLDTQQRDGLPPGYGFGLPNEAEWEKAARGTHGNKWSWGDDFETGLCNLRDGGVLGTTPVGAYSPGGDSPYGVADMSGNVWEWTVTLWGEDREKSAFVYPYHKQDGREDLSAGEACYRVIRGGSFKDDRRGVRCACRDLDLPGFSLNNLGFRIFVRPKSAGN